MNRRTFLKSVGLGLLACVVPTIPVEEEKPKATISGVDVGSKEESKTATIRIKNPGKLEDLQSEIKTRIDELKNNPRWIYSTHNCECQLCDLQGDIIHKSAWSKWMEGVSLYHLTAEDGMYYEVIREAMLAPNPDSESKFDGISHLFDKET